MAVSVQPKIAGLDDLEMGLRTLKRSKLLVTPEFKDMLFAVERHHNDLKLAHLTGKAKDLVDQAQRDTKFYNILVKMLCEIKEKRTGEQREGLRRVYTWYMANKHALYSGPRFGKEFMKQEAKEILVKASTPRKPKPQRQTRWASSTKPLSASSQQRNRTRSAPSVRIREHTSTWRDSSFDWRNDLNKGILKKDPPVVERLQLGHMDDNDYEIELKRLGVETENVHNSPLNTADTATTANSELLREARMLSRAHTGSPTMTPLGEQSTNIEACSVTPQKIVHPISSLVNPHATIAAQLAREKQDKLLAQKKVGEEKSRAKSLKAWQDFNKDFSCGQDVIDRLNFVGRSGTANDVRYFSHDHAEMPEVYTQNIITGYAQVLAEESDATKDAESKNCEQKENVFVNQTLEEFYETADALYPGQTRPTTRARVKSAPAVGRKVSQQSSKAATPSVMPGAESPSRKLAPQPLGHLLQDQPVREEEKEVMEEQTTNVKLDAVVKVIDSVSEEMTLFKERLAPKAQQGFRQPVATGIPTTTTSHSPTRFPSPEARTNSPVHSQVSMQTKPPRPYSSPLRCINLGEGVESPLASPRSRKDRCKSAGVVDWRGRIQPDSMRYKWGKTKFGGYTFVKKHMQRPLSLRSAGSTSAGKRPKTAPTSARNRWNTEKPSDDNRRVEAQAASNSMTQIKQEDVDTMVTIQYLLGTSNSRADSLASLYSLDEEFLRSLRRSVHVPADAPKEFVSFIAPSPAALIMAGRQSQARNYSPSFERPQTAIGQVREAQNHYVLPDFDDLHLPLGLEPDIPEDDDSLAGGDVGNDDEDDLQQLDSGPEREESGEEQWVEEEEEGVKQGEGEEGEKKYHEWEREKEEAREEQERADEWQDEAEQEARREDDVTVKEDVQQEGVKPAQADADSVNETGGITQVTSIAPNNQSPHPASHRAVQSLNLSQVWQFDPSENEDKKVKQKPQFYVGPSAAPRSKGTTQPHQQTRQQLFSPRIGTPMATAETATFPKVERSAGRMPSQAFSPSAQMTQLSRRRAELMRRAPPPRTPPSIPLPKARSLNKGRSPRLGPMLSELEHHARKERSPRNFMQHVTDLRSSGDAFREVSTAFSPESLVGTLQVCRLSMPLSRQHSLPTLYTDLSASQEAPHSILKQPAEQTLFPEPNLHIIDETKDMSEMEKTVHFYGTSAVPLTPLHRPQSPLQAPPKPMTAPATFASGFQRSESLGFLRQVTSSQQSSRNGSLHSSRNASVHGSLYSSRNASLHSSQRSSRNNSEPNTPSTRNLARIGRPIAQVAHVPDPNEVAEAVQKQKEAAAAVDIQRIFRGYVARNVYKKLMSTERQNMEDKQKAAVGIQRAYRSHLGRKEAIERRPPNPEMMEWGNNYRATLTTREQQRYDKVEERAEELSDNFHSAQSKLSVIGPHVNIYEIYHPKKTGPTKKELNMAATTIQRHIRGWLVRRRFDKLHRKAAWYGSTFPKMVKDYKSMLIRIQRQHGVEQPQAPFTTKDMNDYIDTRKRYESVFDKKAFGGELEHGDTDSFFKECDLYPSKTEIEEAMKIALKGETLSRKSSGLKRQEILDVVFYIYTPRAAGLENTRQSTWMNPIIDGVEARRLIGSEFVEEAPLEVCANLVISVKREQRERERAAERARKDEEAAALRERLGLPHPKDDEEEEEEEEEKKRLKKLRRVSLNEHEKKN
ncbi:uncharacterized protein [Littorina saxatilis]|uniref:uncharacterized protein isoform X2 n=1 Tax=Littorina saxatilis TaxID=31220 RepID=UPI0038B42445